MIDTKVYAGSLVAIFISIFALPLDEMFKIYLSIIVGIVSVIVNALYVWKKLRSYIINKLYMTVFYELMKDSDLKKIIDMRARELVQHGLKTLDLIEKDK
jgi:hypothetical protein